MRHVTGLTPAMYGFCEPKRACHLATFVAEATDAERFLGHFTDYVVGLDYFVVIGTATGRGKRPFRTIRVYPDGGDLGVWDVVADGPFAAHFRLGPAVADFVEYARPAWDGTFDYTGLPATSKFRGAGTDKPKKGEVKKHVENRGRLVAEE